MSDYRARLRARREARRKRIADSNRPVHYGLFTVNNQINYTGIESLGRDFVLTWDDPEDDFGVFTIQHVAMVNTSSWLYDYQLRQMNGLAESLSKDPGKALYYIMYGEPSQIDNWLKEYVPAESHSEIKALAKEAGDASLKKDRGAETAAIVKLRSYASNIEVLSESMQAG